MVPAIAGVFRASALVHERGHGSGGLAVGSLVDLHADDGAGAFLVALRLAARQQASGRTIVVVDAMGDFYPPAAAKAGLDLGRLLVLRSRDVLACLDESLRSKAVGAVVARVRRLDGAQSHRLRVAAEAGGGLGLLVRPLDERTAVSAAAVRLVVRATPPAERFGERGFELEPLRVRGDVALATWRLAKSSGPLPGPPR